MITVQQIKGVIIIKIINDVFNNLMKVNNGDLLYWSTDGGLTYTHATIISDVLDDDVLYTGHTNNRLDAILKDALSGYQVAIVHLNDYVLGGGIDE